MDWFCTPKARALLLLILIFSVMQNEKKSQVSPVPTINEQTSNSVFIEHFKKLYLKQPIETILQHFADCHIRLAELEQLEIDRKEVING